ncbi:RING-type E3 ubiquitin transferase [Trifolium repens]|nr:RING-type E3 ubiquitin transferase [Trifolium repens]
MEPCTKDSEENIDSGKDVNKKNSLISVMISNPHAFDCCACFQPLTIPVFQCDNGHIVCSTCCPNLGNKCDKCSKRVSLKRCIAFDNLLQYVKMSCSNEKYGCKETISYSEKRKHEEECIYVPCYCPLSGCDFVASSEVLSDHFSHKHGHSRICFSYGSSFVVSLKANDEVIVLQEKTNGKLFVLSNSKVHLGNAVNISCIGPNSSKPRFRYDILARSQIGCLKLQYITKNIQRSTLATPSSEFLLIPYGDFEPLKLEVCITTKIKIITRRKSGNKTDLWVEISDTIADLKEKFMKMEGIPVNQQRLIFGKKQLDDDRTIADYTIQDNSIIYLTSR